MKEIGVYKIYTRADLSLSKDPDANNLASELILSNNLLYNLYFFV